MTSTTPDRPATFRHDGERGQGGEADASDAANSGHPAATTPDARATTLFPRATTGDTRGPSLLEGPPAQPATQVIPARRTQQSHSTRWRVHHVCLDVAVPASGPKSAEAATTIDLDRSLPRATVRAMESARVTLSGDLSGDYVIEERRPDGRVVLRPDLSVKAMFSRQGERELTSTEFEQHFGKLPTDGEG